MKNKKKNVHDLCVYSDVRQKSFDLPEKPNEDEHSENSASAVAKRATFSRFFLTSGHLRFAKSRRPQPATTAFSNWIFPISSSKITFSFKRVNFTSNTIKNKNLNLFFYSVYNVDCVLRYYVVKKAQHQHLFLISPEYWFFKNLESRIFLLGTEEKLIKGDGERFKKRKRNGH